MFQEHFFDLLFMGQSVLHADLYKDERKGVITCPPPPPPPPSDLTNFGGVCFLSSVHFD